MLVLGPLLVVTDGVGAAVLLLGPVPPAGAPGISSADSAMKSPVQFFPWPSKVSSPSESGDKRSAMIQPVPPPARLRGQTNRGHGTEGSAGRQGPMKRSRRGSFCDATIVTWPSWRLFWLARSFSWVAIIFR